ncbi:MAG: hypothetical protein M1383_02040 [Patescibacteria group bacterium]|nr:hypothetical protein [Patescibacteria group bacterium]
METKKIGIMGLGFVGGALMRYFKTRPVSLFLYDKYKKIGSVEEVNKADIVFICVPTPFLDGKGFDLSAVKDAIGELQGAKIVVIKSTILPGTTENLQKTFPRHKFLFNPEFLREVSPYEDLIRPDRQILGSTKESQAAAKEVMGLLPKAPFEKIMPATEAETVKYMANSFLALKVVFANEFYDICKEIGIDYALVKEAVVKDPRIGDSHFDVGHGGYRGYGGSCFPKDVNAILQLAEDKKVRVSLLNAMRKANKELLEESGLNEDFFLQELHKKKKEEQRA